MNIVMLNSDCRGKTAHRDNSLRMVHFSVRIRTDSSLEISYLSVQIYTDNNTELLMLLVSGRLFHPVTLEIVLMF